MTKQPVVNLNLEKRQAPRFITNLPVGVKLFSEHKHEVKVLRVVNFSRSGMSLIISDNMQFGVDVPIHLHLKIPSAKALVIKGTAKIRRCEEMLSHVDHHKQFLCGVSLKLTIEDEQRLDNFIKQLVHSGDCVVDRRNSARLRNGMSFSNPAIFSSFRLGQDSPLIQIRQLGRADIEELERVEIEAWGKEMCATKDMLLSRIEVFPDGMLGAFKEGKLCGYICVMIVDFASCEKDFTWMGITDGGFIRATHNPKGDCLYGVSLSVVPTAPKDTAAKLIKASLKLFLRNSLRGILFGCRIPLYHKYASKMTPEQYIAARSSKGRVLDPELALYQQVNAVPLRVIPNYFEDPESHNNGVLCFHENPIYAIQKRQFPFFIKDVTIKFT